MRATMLLCDYAQESGGKLFIIGGGWSITGPGPSAMGLAIKMEVPWDRSNHKYHMLLELLDADGQPATIKTPMGDQQIRIEGDFEAGRPAGLLPGTPLDVAVAINIPPVQLRAGSRFIWKLTIDDETSENWQLGFTTRPDPSQSGPAARE